MFLILEILDIFYNGIELLKIQENNFQINIKSFHLNFKLTSDCLHGRFNISDNNGNNMRKMQ